ncbi:MAG: NAD(P)H-hydrate epimerase [Candidatus Thorarchaeota archaeon]|nr:MAG: NAD(P)H-hydrate epimerase [Candidatus Thorarchaeota archaeon]
MMEELHVPVELMMEHAGLCLARTAIIFGGNTSRHFIVIAGPGNNSGGGLVAARRLHAWEQSVTVIVPKGTDGLRPASKHQLSRVLASGVEVTKSVPTTLKPDVSSILLDAYLGYGFTGRDDSISDAVFCLLRRHPSVISLDAPSGLDVSTGENVGGLKPKLIVTVAFVKQGLLSTSPENVGELLVCDIGVPTSVFGSRLGIDWRSPLKKESLRDLSQAFSENPIQEVESLADEGDCLCWLPRRQPIS